MTRVLVLYYSSYGHIETMADAVAVGVRAAGAEAEVRRVPELVSPVLAERSHYKLDQPALIATVDELPLFDAIIVGTGTRYGRLAAQMAHFWDGTGALWRDGGLVGKVGAAFTATDSQHGGQETTLIGLHTMLLHHGMVIVGLPPVLGGALTHAAAPGYSPYGASTLAPGDGRQPPSEVGLAGARLLGRHVAEIATRLAR